MKIFRFWFPLALYSVMIFYVSSLPGGPQGITIPKVDKILHIVEYIPFGFLLSRAFSLQWEGIKGKDLLFLVFLGSFLFGLSDEFHQSFVPLRHASWGDVWADALGGLGGGLIYCAIRKNKK